MRNNQTSLRKFRQEQASNPRDDDGQLLFSDAFKASLLDGQQHAAAAGEQQKRLREEVEVLKTEQSDRLQAEVIDPHYR